MIHDAGNFRLVLEIENKHDEFVAAKSRDHKALLVERIKPLRKQPQQHVARMVAKRIVDMLEVIDVDDDQRRKAVRARNVRTIVSK
jgi:hypothetical protein